jgi:hypothetical protein
MLFSMATEDGLFVSHFIPVNWITPVKDVKETRMMPEDRGSTDVYRATNLASAGLLHIISPSPSSVSSSSLKSISAAAASAAFCTSVKPLSSST